MNLVLLGAPGAGKGTQGALLAERYELARISTGDLLREAVRDGSELGEKARSFMDVGELVPDDVILGLVREVLTGGKGEGGAIFDGFPRTVRQARALDRLLAELGRSLDHVVVVVVPEEVLVKRLSGRRTCSGCGAVFNIYTDPPADPDVCPRCGGKLQQRSDDSAETVRRRLRVYEEQTEPVIRYYRDAGAPIDNLDGARDVDEVFADLVSVLDR